MTGFRVELGSDGAFCLSGELDMGSADGFIRSVMASLDSQRELVLDATELDFIDSTGIRALLDVARVVRPIPVVVRSPRANVAKVFEIVNIEALGIRIDPGRPHAV